MVRTILKDDQWERIAPLLLGKPGDAGRHGHDNRLFAKAVFMDCPSGLSMERFTAGVRCVD